jgi:hypothetical protein
VDRDVDVFKHLWPQLIGSYADCSPVAFPPAFTRFVLDGKETPDALRQRCVSSFERLLSASEYVVVEGTGHIGVGTIVGLNNAQAAARASSSPPINRPARPPLASTGVPLAAPPHNTHQRRSSPIFVRAEDQSRTGQLQGQMFRGEAGGVGGVIWAR